MLQSVALLQFRDCGRKDGTCAGRRIPVFAARERGRDEERAFAVGKTSETEFIQRLPSRPAAPPEKDNDSRAVIVLARDAADELDATHAQVHPFVRSCC